MSGVGTGNRLGIASRPKCHSSVYRKEAAGRKGEADFEKGTVPDTLGVDHPKPQLPFEQVRVVNLQEDTLISTQHRRMTKHFCLLPQCEPISPSEEERALAAAASVP
jgi:hypothetical protein